MPRNMIRSPRQSLLAVAALGALAVAGCGSSTGNDAGGRVVPSSESSPATSSSSAGAELTIVVSTGSGAATTWHLTCDPAGGDHPDPATACAALQAGGDQALPPVPKDRMCTQIYGGDQTARITGTWRGKPVDASLKRTNGCEIARWNALIGLLPKPSV
jgi:hypothetical protein